ncbi:MAG: phosphate ABC transporter permease PstA [Deltaproteobacteria bacterium]|nr:phosphate ABC transporter permease PstA [Deltaproteobacteria bacterium]
MLALSLLMVTGLVTLVLVNGLGFFWPRGVERLVLDDGTVVVGEVSEREAIPAPDAPLGTPAEYRLQVKRGNRDVEGSDFLWIDEARIARRERPADVVVLERREWGNFYGEISALRQADRAVATGPAEAWAALEGRLSEALRLHEEIFSIEKGEIGANNHAQERLRLRLRGRELRGARDGAEIDAAHREIASLQAAYQQSVERLTRLRQGQNERLVATIAGGREVEIPLDKIVRAYRPNRMGAFAKAGFYATKLWEFVSADPRESNTEGGVFPAIFGTVMMVMIMSVLVTPLGIVAAVYLREYAKQGPFVSAVRIAVNNLAGVPSIVFGVFGVGFFIYTIGGTVDRWFFPEALPTPTFGTGGILWASLTLALLTVPVVIVATEEGLAAVPRGVREASLALAATKFETTWRVVLPAVLPSILTGLILAMARAAGEVAPLMITGVVKLAPALPLDGFFPFFHFERKFMHLGFHIYDVGFQSPNVDVARPMVYMTTVLLLTIVLFLNLTAILLRNRLRRRLQVSAV